VHTACDPAQIRQVLSNLVNNAAQASETGGRITLTAQNAPESVSITIADEGRGIPESERDKVFLPYYSKSAKGTGLGLAIVKRIIEDHNGTIAIEDNRPRGTRFVITLPRA
jgi:signal transduction histidine kinase